MIKGKYLNDCTWKEDAIDQATKEHVEWGLFLCVCSKSSETIDHEAYAAIMKEPVMSGIQDPWSETLATALSNLVIVGL